MAVVGGGGLSLLVAGLATRQQGSCHEACTSFSEKLKSSMTSKPLRSIIIHHPTSTTCSPKRCCYYFQLYH
jgi:hypothetical protein